MHSLISRKGEYVGVYLRVKNTERSIRLFAKIYNLAVEDPNFYITYNDAKDLLLSNSYESDNNNIYANDVETDEIIITPVKFGNYAVFINNTKKLYILTESKFKKFVRNNRYRKETSNNYILAIDDGDKFINFRIISTDSLADAKQIFRKKYNNEPVFIGLEEDDFIYIKTDDGDIVLKIEKGKDLLFRV